MNFTKRFVGLLVKVDRFVEKSLQLLTAKRHLQEHSSETSVGTADHSQGSDAFKSKEVHNLRIPHAEVTDDFNGVPVSTDDHDHDGSDVDDGVEDHDGEIEDERLDDTSGDADSEDSWYMETRHRWPSTMIH